MGKNDSGKGSGSKSLFDNPIFKKMDEDMKRYGFGRNKDRVSVLITEIEDGLVVIRERTASMVSKLEELQHLINVKCKH